MYSYGKVQASLELHVQLGTSNFRAAVKRKGLLAD